VSLPEAKEKLEKGIFLMIREGSNAKNLEELLPIVNDRNFLFTTFVADDIDPGDLIDRGHIDYFLKKAVSLGLDPITAVRMVTISPAIHFGLSDIGALSPGRIADIVVLDDLSDFKVKIVFKRGVIVARDGAPTFEREKKSTKYPKSMNARLPKRDALRIPWEKRKARVIKVIHGQIITDEIDVELKEKGGYAVSDIDRDILKAAVFERHRRTGNVGLGFISGFGLKEGAVASSVGHDSHNIIVVGIKDEDIYLAAERIVEIGGGQLVIKNGEVISELPLPVAGIMSDGPLEEVESAIKDNLAAAREIGCVLENPFMALSFLALPVIPKLKITDRGLVDVTKFSLVPLYL
jgi:adenine deaminase